MSNFLLGCNLAIQESLYALNPNRQLYPVGVLKYLLEQAAKFPASKNIIASDGKYAKYQIYSNPIICGTENCDTNICDANGVSVQTRIVEREIKKCVASPVIKFSEKQLKSLCTGQMPDEFISQSIANLVPSFLNQVDKQLSNEIYALRGQFTDGSSIKSISLINNDYQATAMGLVVDEDLKMAGLGAFGVTLIGGQTVSTYAKVTGVGGVNNAGINTGALPLYNAVIDYNLASVSPGTSENAFVIADGVLSLVTFSENTGLFSSGTAISIVDSMKTITNLSGTYWNGVIDLVRVLPEYKQMGVGSFPVDLSIKYDDCEKVFKVQFKLHYDLWLNAPEMCDFKGVNGIQHWQICKPVPVACAPVVLPPPPAPVGVKCFGLPCAIPFVAYSASVDGASISAQSSIADINELVTYLNQLEPNAFKVQGSQVQYKGAGVDVKVNGLSLPAAACLQGDCYLGIKATTALTALELAAYANLGGASALGTIVLTQSTATEFTYQFTPLAPNTVTLAQIQAYATAQGDNVVWAIAPTCA